VKLSPSGWWTVSLLVDVVIEVLPESPNQIGLDLGITSLIALSNGEKVANPKAFKVKRRKLRKAQKALSRKKKGSNNRHKARLKVAKVHAEISEARHDILHKLTTRLVRENQTIAVEDLSVKNMVKNRKLALAAMLVGENWLGNLNISALGMVATLSKLIDDFPVLSVVEIVDISLISCL
jgi:putative transposase